MQRTNQTELLDREAESVPTTELAGNLRDIRRANRYFGGTRAVLRAIAPELAAAGSATVLMLDLATGSADIPLAIVREARRQGRSVQVLATDLQPSVLAIARAAEQPGVIAVEQADARGLAYGAGAFDIVTLSLALHHFVPEEATLVLTEMRRVGRRLLLVNDLERTRAGFVGAWLMGHCLTGNRLTRNDAPLSVRRAYTREEASALARHAGWHDVRVSSAFAFRYVLTGMPGPDG